jgi:hypothetical protein
MIGTIFLGKIIVSAVSIEEQSDRSCASMYYVPTKISYILSPAVDPDELRVRDEQRPARDDECD